jgi:hypothetical protein
MTLAEAYKTLRENGHFPLAVLVVYDVLHVAHAHGHAMSKAEALQAIHKVSECWDESLDIDHATQWAIEIALKDRAKNDAITF